MFVGTLPTDEDFASFEDLYVEAGAGPSVVAELAGLHAASVVTQSPDGLAWPRRPRRRWSGVVLQRALILRGRVTHGRDRIAESELFRAKIILVSSESSSIVTLVIRFNVKRDLDLRGRIVGAPRSTNPWRTWQAIAPRVHSSNVVGFEPDDQ